MDANFELAAEWARRAVAEGAQLVAFPELALTGYLLSDLVPEVAMPAADPRLTALSRDAGDLLLVIGFVEETDDHRYANSAALLRNGELLAVHRKVYLPTYGLFDEGRFTRAGDRIRTHEVGEPLGRIGLSVCEDFWHPSLPMLQAQEGASLLVNLAAGPARAPGSAAGTRGDRRLAQDAGHLRAAGNGGDRLLQPGRQRGRAHLLGRIAPAGRRRLRRSPKGRSTRRRWWSAAWRPMTCACSATACRCWPTSGWS